MKNLEQIRAANALAFANAGLDVGGKEGGNVLKKVPALIMGNGLLAAGAFACAQREQRDNGWKNCFNHIAIHLAHPDISILPTNVNDLDGMMQYLTGGNADSQTLKLATDEALAWLGYARRFA
jgi:CRISPR/Cas system CMR-associated protein Cmr5 small subunit